MSNELPYFIAALRYGDSSSSPSRFYWNTFDGQPTIVTYSFMSSVPTDENVPTTYGDPFATFQPFTEVLKEEARLALQAFQAVSGLVFVEISTAEELAGNRGLIEFGRHDGIAGYASYPFTDNGQPIDAAGNVFRVFRESSG